MVAPWLDNAGAWWCVLDGSCPAFHFIIAPVAYVWKIWSTWKLYQADLCYGVSWAWDFPVRTYIGYSQHNEAVIHINSIKYLDWRQSMLI